METRWNMLSTKTSRAQSYHQAQNGSYHNACTLRMHDLPCSNSAPMALCMSMWMHVHGIKTIKHKIKPNSNMW